MFCDEWVFSFRDSSCTAKGSIFHLLFRSRDANATNVSVSILRKTAWSNRWEMRYCSSFVQNSRFQSFFFFFFCDFKLHAKQMNTNIASVETRWTWSRVQWQLKWTKQDFQRLNPQLWILYHFLRVKEVKICLLRWTRRQNKPVQTLFGHSRHQVRWLLLCCTSE